MTREIVPVPDPDVLLAELQALHEERDGAGRYPARVVQRLMATLTVVLAECRRWDRHPSPEDLSGILLIEIREKLMGD